MQLINFNDRNNEILLNFMRKPISGDIDRPLTLKLLIWCTQILKCSVVHCLVF